MTLLMTCIEQALPEEASFDLDQTQLNILIDSLMSPIDVRAERPFTTDAVLRACGINNAELQARSGGWVFHLRKSVAQSAVSGVIMAIALKATTATPLSLAMIPALLPYLFQVEKTQLSMHDEELLLYLYRRDDSNVLSINDLYERLPAHVREDINRLDLLSFLDRVVGTGHAKETERGIFSLRHPDHPRLVIRIV